MTVIDYVIVGILVCSAIAGVVRGFLREVISAITWVLAFFLAWQYGPLIEPYLERALHDPTLRAWAARVPVFLLVLVAGAGIGALITHLVRLSIFSGLDRLLGLIFGVLRGLVILGVAAIICQAVRLDRETWWGKSILMPHVETAANILRTLVGEERIRRFTPTRAEI